MNPTHYPDQQLIRATIAHLNDLNVECDETNVFDTLAAAATAVADADEALAARLIDKFVAGRAPRGLAYLLRGLVASAALQLYADLYREDDEVDNMEHGVTA